MARRTEKTVLWMGPLPVAVSAGVISGAGVLVLDMGTKIIQN
jgi:hypothetical protein